MTTLTAACALAAREARGATNATRRARCVHANRNQIGRLNGLLLASPLAFPAPL